MRWTTHKILFTTRDIIGEFQLQAYVKWHDFLVSDPFVPLIEAEKIMLFSVKKRGRKWISELSEKKYIQWIEDGEQMVMEWVLPTDRFLSSIVWEWIKKIPE